MVGGEDGVNIFCKKESKSKIFFGGLSGGRARVSELFLL